MTPYPISLELTASVFDAFTAMAQGRFRHLPVVHRGMLVGIVSDRDLLAQMPAPTSAGAAKAQGRFARQGIATIMSHDPITVHVDELASAAISIMLAEHIDALPVVDSAGFLVGIVTLVDVARSCFALIDDENSAPRSAA